MESKIKKIRILVFCSLAFILLESVVGIGSLFSGVMYSSFEKEKADLNLELLKHNNKEYYEKITSDEESLALNNFYANFQTKGNPLLILNGHILLAFSFLNALPLLLIVFLIMKKEKKEEEKEIEEKVEKEEEKKEEEKKGEERDKGQ